MIAQALRLMVPTLKDLARELGVSYSLLRHYRIADRTPPEMLAKRLATVMRKRARELERQATKLSVATRKPKRRGKP